MTRMRSLPCRGAMRGVSSGVGWAWLSASNERRCGAKSHDGGLEVRSTAGRRLGPGQVLSGDRRTLDARAELDGMPFMPEMVKFSGRRFRISAVAHKTCDTVNKTGGRAWSMRCIWRTCAVTAAPTEDARRPACCSGRLPGCALLQAPCPTTAGGSVSDETEGSLSETLVANASSTRPDGVADLPVPGDDAATMDAAFELVGRASVLARCLERQRLALSGRFDFVPCCDIPIAQVAGWLSHLLLAVRKVASSGERISGSARGREHPPRPRQRRMSAWS